MKVDYRQFTDKKLKEKLEELEFRKIRSSNRRFPSRKEEPANHSRFRREIARIKTEQTRRKIQSEN
ncbi:MAG: hypothetical protein KJI69_05640 [Patescibacteria group bacterium]|nr:hypothetical protein [Patescibacteria group bacterium]